MNEFVYDGNSRNFQKVIDLHSRVEKILYYKCGAELLIIASLKEEQQYKKISGIYCSVNETHIRQWIAVADLHIEFWKRFAPHLLAEGDS